MSDETKRLGLDPELQAMARLDRIMRELSNESLLRVLTWLVSKWEHREEIACGDERENQQG